MARLAGYLTCCDSDVITGTIWTFLDRRGTVGIGLIVPTPELIAAVRREKFNGNGRVRPGISVGREKRVNGFRRGSALQIGERVVDLSVAIGLTSLNAPAACGLIACLGRCA